MDEMDGITVFSSATAEPKKGFTDQEVVGRLGGLPEVRKATILIGGFISVRFNSALDREALSRFKKSIAEFATIHERRKSEFHEAAR